MSNKIKKDITVYVPGNMCNLRCSYCYVSCSSSNELNARPHFDYSVEHMVSAFDPTRLGGSCAITIIGAAETLIPEETVGLIKGLIHQGHLVTVVTNATLTDRIKELLDSPKDDLKNLIIKGSLHYTELKKRNLLDTYFDNLKLAIDKGASAYPFLVICNEYLPYLDEIREICMDRLGCLPLCTPCFAMNDELDLIHTEKLDPPVTDELRSRVDNLFHSKLYEECLRYSKINPQEQFCYAGLWTFGVLMESGNMLKCHNNPLEWNFFRDISTPIADLLTEPVACSCGIASCALQYNYFSYNILPDAKGKYLFGDLIYQKGSLREDARDRLNVDMSVENARLPKSEENRIAFEQKEKQYEECLAQLRYVKNYAKDHGLNIGTVSGSPFFNLEIIKNAFDKNIYIYGIGGDYKTYSDTISFQVAGYIKSCHDENESFNGLPVFTPEEIRYSDSKAFIVICSSGHYDEMAENLKSLGYVKRVDFI